VPWSGFAVARRRPLCPSTIDRLDRQTHAEPARLRGVERVEQAIGLEPAEADAAVLHRDDRARPIADRLAGRPDDEPALLGRDLSHGLRRIDEEVDEHLLELDPISQHRRQVRCDRHLERDPLAVELRADEREHVADDPGEIAGLAGHDRAREQGADPDEHVGGPGPVRDDGAERLANLAQRRAVGAEPVETGVRVGDDGGQGLIDLVGDRGGQLAQRGHARHPRQLDLDLVQGLLGALALGDLVVRLEDRGGTSGRGAPEGPAARHRHRRSVAPGVDQLPLPAPGADQLGHDAR